MPDLRPLRVDHYEAFFSSLSKARRPSPIRSLFPLELRPGMISLLAGKPNPSVFPINNLRFNAGDDEVSVDPALLAQGLQYGATAGIPPLVSWIEELQHLSHARVAGETEGWRISVGTGSQDCLYKAFLALLEKGDSVLIESPAYAGVLPVLESLNVNLTEVATDAEGIQSASLEEILNTWPADKPKPKLLYTVPYGGNPTGATASVIRRSEVLALARKHNFLIMEDDPYFYLYYGKEARPPSYFALEATESPNEVGRVLRFDSFSKVLSAGMRLGCVSGPKLILDRMDLHSAVAHLQSSSLTQVIAVSLLSSWGHSGFLSHCARVADFYRAKRDAFESAMQRHLSGLAVWAVPQAGMFYWFKLLLGEEGGAEVDSATLVRSKMLEANVLLLPGTSFIPSGKGTPYVRASFSLLDADVVDTALERVAKIVRESRSNST